MPRNPMKPTDASRIQSSQAKSGNPTGAKTFPARSQSAAQTNVNRGIVNPSGGTSTPKTTPASSAGKTQGAASRK